MVHGVCRRGVAKSAYLSGDQIQPVGSVFVFPEVSVRFGNATAGDLHTHYQPGWFCNAVCDHPYSPQGIHPVMNLK